MNVSKPKVAKLIALQYANRMGIHFKFYNHSDLRRIITFNKKIFINNLQVDDQVNKEIIIPNKISTTNNFTFTMNLNNKYGRNKGVNIDNITKLSFDTKLINSWCTHRTRTNKRIGLAEGLFDLTMGLVPANKLKYTVAIKKSKPVGGIITSKYVSDTTKPPKQYNRIYKQKFNFLGINENIPNYIHVIQYLNQIKNNIRSNIYNNYHMLQYICSDKDHKGIGIALILFEMTHLPKNSEGLIAEADTEESKKLLVLLGFSKLPRSQLTADINIYKLDKAKCTSPHHIISKLDSDKHNMWITKYYKMCFRPRVQQLVTNDKSIINYSNKNTFKFSCV